MTCVEPRMPTPVLHPHFAVLFCATATLAQAQPRIMAHTAIIANPAAVVGTDQQIQLAGAGMSQEALDRLLASDAMAQWPIGLRTDSARQVHAKAMRNFTVRIVSELEVGDQRLAVVVLPMLENLHMPEDLRSPSDLYLAVLHDGLDRAERAVKRPVASPGPRWDHMPKARITRPDAIYATYDLASDPEAVASLERLGLSRPEIEAVIFRSHQRNWPEGIDAFEKRWPRLKSFKRFKAYKAVQWDDKVLVVVPAEQNQDLPENLRPSLDIYMVYAAPAISVKGK